MTNSNVSNARFKPRNNIAYPHSRVEGKLQIIPFENLDNAAPGDSINSSAADMAKWVLLQLNRGKLLDRDARLFCEAPGREMWSPQTILLIPEPPEPLAALQATSVITPWGWMVRDYHGRSRVIAHDIQIDKPEAVVDAIRKVVDQVEDAGKQKAARREFKKGGEGSRE